MCGITGIINFNNDETIQSVHLHQMTSRIKHRGPDDEGYLFITKNGCMVFSGDDTPVINKDKCTNCGTCVAVCTQMVFENNNGNTEVKHPDRCTNCNMCVDSCAQKAVTLKE